MSTSTVERAIRGGGLRASRTSGRVLIHREWAETWFEQLQSSARPRPSPAILALCEATVAPAASPPRPVPAALDGRSDPAEAWPSPHFVALDELYRRVVLDRRVHGRSVGLDAHELERWLVEQRLARTTGSGRLIPTALGVELGGSL